MPGFGDWYIGVMALGNERMVLLYSFWSEIRNADVHLSCSDSYREHASKLYMQAYLLYM